MCALYKGSEIVAGLSKNTIVNGFHLFDFKWSDKRLNDISWLESSTFSWHSGDVYTTAYNKLVEEYQLVVIPEETEGGVTFKRSANGFKIADSTQEQAILEKYNTDGIAWYYILDTANKCFKLPRTKFGFEGLRTYAGNDIGESLPNITGSLIQIKSGGSGGSSGAFTRTRTGTYGQGSATGSSEMATYTFTASRSSSAYKNNAPVQEHATQMYLYFYVGEYSRDAIEQTAGLNTEIFNNKADKSEVDGQWVNKQLQLQSTLSVTASTTNKVYDLSDYLPKDNNSYEVLISSYITTPATTNSFMQTILKTQYVNALSICRVRAASASGTQTRGSALIPVGPDRQLTWVQDQTSSNFNGSYDLILWAYRRVGTNI